MKTLNFKSDCNLGYKNIKKLQTWYQSIVVTYFTTGARVQRSLDGMLNIGRILTPQPQLGESFQRLVQRHIM